MTDNRKQLQKELSQVGASASEAKELLSVVASLRLLKDSQPAAAQKDTKPTRWAKIRRPVAFTSAGFAVGMFLVIFSQAALPTSLLYPVQKFSDSIAETCILSLEQPS